MDGWPLPAVGERLNERGAVVTWLPTLRPKTGGGGGGEGWVKERAGTGWLDEDLAWDDVLKWDKVSEGWQRDRLGDRGEEVGVGWGSPHTPVPEGTAEREITLCKNRESRWNERSQRWNRFRLLESMRKCSSDSGDPWQHDDHDVVSWCSAIRRPLRF